MPKIALMNTTTILKIIASDNDDFGLYLKSKRCEL